MDAIFRHGSPVMLDYTPATDIPAGTVLLGVIAGLTTVITHRDLEANVMGAVAAGGGIYEMTNLDNAPDHTKVYFDNTGKKATTTATGNALLGYVASRGGGGVDSKCWVLHDPRG